MNFATYLPVEITQKIFENLTAIDLVNGELVSKEWKRIIELPHNWRILVATPPRSTIKSKRLWTKLLNNEECSDWKSLYQILGSINDTKNKLSLIEAAVASSSCDDPSQEIGNTLNQKETFWSSKGSDDEDSNEWLIYKLKQPICIITDLSIWVYKALYQAGLPTYGPKQIQVSVGFTPDKMHYTSPIFDCQNTQVKQIFELSPELVIGGYIRIDLFKRNTRQPGDELFYTVLKSVFVFGIPLGTNFSALSEALINFSTSKEDFIDYMIKELHAIDTEDAKEVMNKMIQANDNYRKIIKASKNTKSPEVFDAQKEVAELVKYSLFKTLQGSVLTEQLKKKEFLKVISYIKVGNFEEAVNVALTSKENIRSEETTQLFVIDSQHYLSDKDYKNLYSLYVNALLQQNKLNKWESVALVKYLLQTNEISKLDINFFERKIYPCEEVGDLLRENGLSRPALIVYMNAHCPDKVIIALIACRMVHNIIPYCRTILHEPNWVSILTVAFETERACGLFLAHLIMVEQIATGTVLVSPQEIQRISGIGGSLAELAGNLLNEIKNER